MSTHPPITNPEKVKVVRVVVPAAAQVVALRVVEDLAVVDPVQVGKLYQSSRSFLILINR